MKRYFSISYFIRQSDVLAALVHAKLIIQLLSELPFLFADDLTIAQGHELRKEDEPNVSFQKKIVESVELFCVVQEGSVSLNSFFLR